MGQLLSRQFDLHKREVLVCPCVVRYFKGVVRSGSVLVRFLSLSLGLLVPVVAYSQDTPDYFRQNCVNCHTIGGGRLTGPDLKDVSKRRDSEWLIKFLQNPKAVIDSGDPYATKMFEESRRVIMPNAPGMDRYRAEQLIKLIDAESKLKKSQFFGIRISNKPFTAKDRLVGRELFIGERKFKKGGTACNSCHTIYSLSLLGGGRLGPDLTHVYERLKGRKAVSAWLMAPATKTMQPIFKNHPLEAGEIHSLTAFFEVSAKQNDVDASVSRITFLLLGLTIAVAVVFLFDLIWRGRFYGVRRPLVDAGVSSAHSQKKSGAQNDQSSSATLDTAVTTGETDL